MHVEVCRNEMTGLDFTLKYFGKDQKETEKKNRGSKCGKILSAVQSGDKHVNSLDFGLYFWAGLDFYNLNIEEMGQGGSSACDKRAQGTRSHLCRRIRQACKPRSPGGGGGAVQEPGKSLEARGCNNRVGTQRLWDPQIAACPSSS